MLHLNLVVLFFAQALGMCATSVMVFSGGLIGTTLTSNPNFATFPPALTILGGAIAAAPASIFMGRFGRRLGFMGASLIGISGSLLAAYAINNQQFSLFCLSAFLLGVNIAFVQQYRFAAAECVDEAHIGRAVSTLLMAGLFSAIVGPEVAMKWKVLEGYADYTGSFLALTAILVLSSLTLFFYQNLNEVRSDTTNDTTNESSIPLASNPIFILAVMGAATAFGVMSMIMTATPISMHVHDGITLPYTKQVIQWHILAMFLPSLLSALLLETLGELLLILMGLLCFCLSIAINLNGQSVLHYQIALVSLGIAWNFMFLGSTTLLTKYFRSAARYKAQAINDLCVFSIQACGAFMAGVILQAWGWQMVNIVAVPAIIVTFLYLMKVKFSNIPQPSH